MARTNQNNRGGNRGRRSNNNNPEGRNQYNSGWMDTARDRPAAAALTAAAAVGAGVFLWSRRNQISEQLTNLSEQIGEWSENWTSESGNREFETVGGDSSFSGSTSTGTSSGLAGGGTSSPSRSRPSGSSRRGASSGTGTGTGAGTSSGTMSGGSLDTGPSGRGRA